MLRRLALPGVLILALLGGLAGWVATSASVAATQSQLAGMRAKVSLPAGRTAVWHSMLTPQGICNYVLWGCTEVQVRDRNHFKVRLNVNLPPAQLRPWVNVVVTQRTASRRMDLQLSSRTATGNLDAKLALRLSGGRSGSPTTLRTKVISARGTGVTGRAAIQMLTQYPATLKLQAQELTKQYTEAGATLDVVLRVQGRKLAISPQVTYAAAMLPTPTPTGTIRVYRNGHRVCTKPLTAGTVTCSIRKPRRGTRITLVATGDLGTGYPLWHTATRRYQP